VKLSLFFSFSFLVRLKYKHGISFHLFPQNTKDVSYHVKGFTILSSSLQDTRKGKKVPKLLTQLLNKYKYIRRIKTICEARETIPDTHL
jgi:hypothetical protein